MLPDPSDRTLPESDRRELVRWTAACAERLLAVFERDCPDDHRPRRSLNGALAFSRGELGVAAMRKLAFECHAAAREAGTPAAIASARTCGQAVAAAHMAGHAREVPRYTTKALSDNPDARAKELAWQREHLPARFTAYVYTD